MKLLTQRLARPRQARLDGPHGHPQREGNLVVAKAVNFAQHNHGSLVERQLVERGPQCFRQFFAGVCPVRRGVIAGLPQVAVGSHVLIEGHLIGLVPAAPPSLPITCVIDGNAVDPSLDRRLAAEAADGSEDTEEDFLGEIEGFVPITQQMQGQLIDHALVSGNQFGTGSRFTRGATLDQLSLATADVGPAKCPGVFHDGFGDNSEAHRECIKIRTRAAPKVPSRFVTIDGVRRTLVAAVLVASTAVAGALAYSALANEREFERLIASGDRAVASDRHFLAIEAYSGAIALKPDSMLAHLKRGAVYQSQEQLEAALGDLRQAVDLDPGALLPVELLGDVNAALGRAERATERYQAYLGLDERNARVHYKLGLARYRSGRIEPAASALLQALKLDPHMGEAHYVLGLVYRDQNKLPAARRSLEEAARRLPASQTEAREALAEVYGREGEHAKAINELEALAALDATRVDRLVALGLAQARAGREDAAVLTLGRAVERFPAAPQAYAALGHVWLTSARRGGDRVALNKAVEALEQAAGRSDASGDTLAELGAARWLVGDLPAAERALRQAVARVPVPPDAYLQLADITIRDGRIQNARDALLTYATLVGDDKPLADVSTRIGDLSMRLGEPGLALRWFSRAIDQAGSNPALQLRLADAAWKSGDTARAHRAVDQGLAADPGHRRLMQMKRRLPIASGR